MSLTNEPSLIFPFGLPLNVSPILPETCRGAVSGTGNPDGQCIMGGSYVNGVCRADPSVWYMEMVPYSTGRVSSTNYTALNNIYQRGNNTTLTSARVNRRT